MRRLHEHGGSRRLPSTGLSRTTSGRCGGSGDDPRRQPGGHGYQSGFAPEVESPIRGSGGAGPRPGRDSGPPGDSPIAVAG
jgi:hypothetical protein